MKRLLGFLLSLICWSASAQNAIYVYPPSPRIPTGGIQSLTAVVTGNANKGVTWSGTGTHCPAIVGSGLTIGVTTSGTGTCTITATMVADGATAASSTITVEAVRTDLQAAGTHPRILFTPADITDLQTKAASGSGNVVYTQGLANIFADMQFYYDHGRTIGGPALFCWAGAGCGTVGPIGTLNSCGWIDGTRGFANSGCPGGSEFDAATYALMSLIDPTTGNRATWAAHAHDLLMWEATEACYNASSGSGACIARTYGGGSNAAFIGSGFIIANRGQQYSLPFFAGLDMVYSTLTSGDKAILASLFHIWGAQVTGANVNDQVSGGNEDPHPVGTYSNPVLFNTGVGTQEGGTNNYGNSHFAIATYLGLLLDPADDPTVSSCAPTTTTLCPTDGTAKTVRAYAVAAVKAWLYRNYAALEDQQIVAAAYSVANPLLCPDLSNGIISGNTNTINCTGSQSGGFMEGTTEYSALSHAIYFPALYSLYIAGKLNPATDPQAAFISSAYWDKAALNFVDQLYPSIPTGGTAHYTPFGDDGNYSNAQPIIGNFFNALEVYDAKYGSTYRKNLDAWYQYNALLDGQNSFAFRWMVTGGLPYNYYGGALFDANLMAATSNTNDGDFSGAFAPNPTPNQYDPRNTSTLPLDFEAASSPGGFYTYYGRNNWTTTGTEFQFRCNTAVQDHATAVCGRFDYLRKGEPVISALNGYLSFTNSDGSQAAPSSAKNGDIVGYQWAPAYDCSTNSAWTGVCITGGQQPDYGKFSNTLLASSSNGVYYFGATDASGAYFANFNSSAADNVNLSQREVLWIKPDLAWIYDRAETTSGSSFKTWDINTQTVASVSGNLATETSTGGQLIYISSLLPGTSSLAASTLNIGGTTPTNGLLVDTAASTSSVRMLHTIEGRDSGAASSTSQISSTSGDAFDGGTVGTTLTMFKHTRGTFTSTQFPASGASTFYVADLGANTTYTVVDGIAHSQFVTTDGAGLATFTAASTGTVSIGSGVPIADTPTFSPPSGTSSSSPITVTISDTTSGASICYTTDGSTPTATTAGTCDGLTYSSPLTVSVSETIKAIATKVAFINSSVGSASYTITTPAAGGITASGTLTISGSVTIP